MPFLPLVRLPRGAALAITVASLLIAACSGAQPAPAATSAREPAPLTLTPTEEAAPSPTPTTPPAPTATPLPRAVLLPDARGQTAYAGTEVTFEVSGLKPLERASILVASPAGALVRWPAIRADRLGQVSWKRDTAGDVTGPWLVQLEGELGSLARIAYTLKELDLPTETVTLGESAFLLYRTPEASFYFHRSVRPATVARMAEIYQQALASVPASLGAAFSDQVDLFLLPGRDALRREVIAAGADPGEGPLAGMSLRGFERPRIYLDVASPFATPSHILTHEFSHQVTAGIAGGRNVPAWLDEGLAEYHGVMVASRTDREPELRWHRLIRDAVRRAIAKGAWIDLGSMASREVWSKETDLERIDQLYGESYVTMDFIAKAYGGGAP